MLNPKLYIITILVYLQFEYVKSNERIVFSFPEYQYKETNRNELIFREFESACEQSGRCVSIGDSSTTSSDDVVAARRRCVRECVSPQCYDEIYRKDQLEDGEIDVRLNSFKGCFIQRSGRPRT